MISFPNAKINLGLRILGKRPDGFHNLETIMYPISLCDAMEVIYSPSRDFSICSSGLPVPGALTDNLCTRAYLLMKAKYDLPQVKMHLHKCIPTGAGLGGGSADAAFTLVMLNKLFSLKLNKEKLQELASALGSDCPFFIMNEPSIAHGRGEILEGLHLSLEPCHILVIKPPVHINTAEAYAAVKISGPGQSLKKALKMPVEKWKDFIFNDFEPYAFNKHPVLRSIKQRLCDLGAIFASLTGSGSAVYGIFDGTPPEMGLGSDHFVWSGKL